MRDVIEVRATGQDDPNGTRSAAVLAAYFHLEQVEVFCRLLWRRLAALGIGWIVFAGLVPGMSYTALGVGLGIFGAVGAGAVVAERRASRNLDRLVRALPAHGKESQLMSPPLRRMAR